MILVADAGPAEGLDHSAPAAPAANWMQPIRGEIGKRIAAAREGDTIEISAGVYRESICIDKPLTLIARGAVTLDGNGNGDIVEITAPGVTLRGFTIRNTGIDLDKENAAIRILAARAIIEDNVLEDVLFGIDLRQAPDSIIRRNTIGGKSLDIARRGDGLRLWRSDRTAIEKNVIHNGRDAILWYSSGIVVRENRTQNCRYGLHLMFSDNVTISGNEFLSNSVGIYLMYSTGVELTKNRIVQNRGPSGYGIGFKETDQFSVRENLIVGNRAGVYIDGSPFTEAKPGEFTRNTIAYNDVGIVFLPSARGNELVGNNFIDNIDQVTVAGRGSLDANRFWKEDCGNFWSDYTGYDQNGDGIGDFVHESQTLFENMMDRQPALRLFLFSPAQQAIEFVGRAVPAVRPEARFTDEVPLMRPVPVACAGLTGDEGEKVTMLGASGAALLGLGGGIVLAACRATRNSQLGSARPSACRLGGKYA
ncbi:MAG: nitrous oxide reductase family maturation protein NosD [Phycisphaerae bacterium]|nr:nitrous oxide reductase family maturation protein NosD [Phycisphaerae bacterium]